MRRFFFCLVNACISPLVFNQNILLVRYADEEFAFGKGFKRLEMGGGICSISSQFVDRRG